MCSSPCYVLALQSSVVALRTSIPPATDEQGVASSRQLGGRLPVAQVNAAIRTVAEALKVPLLDCEMHVAGYVSKQMLRDFHHAAPFLNHEWQVSLSRLKM